MAAQMPIMAPGGQMRPRSMQQGNQVSSVMMNLIMSQSQSQPPPRGWQASVGVSQRVQNAMNLYSNAILAVPQNDQGQTITQITSFERDAYATSASRELYDQKIRSKLQELFSKRQANEPSLQSALNQQQHHQAAAQLQAQQAGLMTNPNMLQQHMRLGQPPQQSFQHLQQQMQASPIPQPQQPGMGMAPGAHPMNPNQQAMQMGAQMRQQAPNIDRGRIQQLALAKYNQTSEQEKASLRAQANARLGAQTIQALQQKGMDPVLVLFQQQMMQMAKMSMTGGGGMNPAAMQMQAQQQQQQQQRPSNPPGQQSGVGIGAGGDLGPFSNAELMNQQKAGLMAQEAGQMVVPASGPGRNTTPQPLGAASASNQGGNQQGPNQSGHPAHPPQQFNMQQAQQLQMDQAAAKTQAQIRAQAQAKQMQGQPGGLGGPGGMSQSPAMTTLNAPVQRPPVAMGQAERQPQMNQGNGAFGQGLDPRFAQGNQRGPMGAVQNRAQLLSAMFSTLSPEQQANLRGAPPERLNEILTRWIASRNGQMPGRPQAQPGQFGQGNQMAQFAPGNNMGQQGNNPIPMNSQNPALVQQQLNRMRANGVPNPSPMPSDPAAATAFMDSLDVPVKVLSQLPGLPPTIRKWGQLKQWMTHSPNIPPQLQAKVIQVQAMQFRTIVAPNQQPQAGVGMQMPPGVPQPPVPQGLGVPQMTGHPGANAALAMALQNINVTPQEIQNARTASEKFKGWPDEKIRMYLLQLKQHQLKSRMGGIMPGGQQQPPPHGPQQAPINQAQAQPTPGPGGPHRPPTTTAEQPGPAGPGKPQQKHAVANRPASQQNPSPALPPKNNKRPSADDVVEVPNPTATPIQRPPSQQTPTPAQLAHMPPEVRAKYEQMMKNRQSQPRPEDIERLKQIGSEAQRQSAQEVLQEIPLGPQQHAEMTLGIRRMITEMGKLGKVLGRWYSLTHDDARAKMYFQMRLRLYKQFEDGDKMTTPKARLSVTRQDLDQVRGLMESMAKELKAVVQGSAQPQGTPDAAQQQGGGAGTGASVRTTPPSQPTPLNAANLERQNQITKHNRSASSQGRPPPPPTTSQPPFPIGAAAPSPHGNPAYIGKPGITQDNLQLPPRKRFKSQQPGQSSGTSASPQAKHLSPETLKRSASSDQKLPRPQFPCTQAECEANRVGFATEEALQAHTLEEHVKPHDNPAKYAMDALAEQFGLDADGYPIPRGDEGMNAGATLASTPSRQGQTPSAAAMSRGPSMKRQESAAGLADAAAKPAGSRPADITASSIKVEEDVTSQRAPTDGVLPFTTIDPQDLFQGLGTVPSGGGGAISDMNVYRSVTPNDTPESSKDSASSEPNSDVSEGVALSVTLDMGFDSWQPFEGDRYVNFGMDVDLDMLDANSAGAMGDQILSEFSGWDEVNTDFNKPFALDTSQYGLDISS